VEGSVLREIYRRVSLLEVVKLLFHGEGGHYRGDNDRDLETDTSGCLFGGGEVNPLGREAATGHGYTTLQQVIRSDIGKMWILSEERGSLGQRIERVAFFRFWFFPRVHELPIGPGIGC